MSKPGTFPTVRQLAIVAAVAELGGVSAAAASLGISQPAVTAQLKAAETQLGRPLFVRRRTGLAPTAAGRAVATFARRQELQVKGLLTSLAGLAHGAGALVVGASITAGEHWLPSRLSALRRAHPRADVRAVIGNSSETLTRVLNRSVDIAVLGRSVRGRGLRCVEIGVERIVPVAARGSRYARGFASARSLADVTFVVREDGSSTRRSALQSLKRIGVVPNRVMPVPSDEAVVNMAAADLGVGLVAAPAAKRALDDGSVAVVRIHGWRCRRRMYAVRRTDAESPLADAFWEIATAGSPAR